MSVTTTLIPPTSAEHLASSSKASNHRQPTWFQRLARRRMIQWMNDVDGGVVRLADGKASVSFGQAESHALTAEWNIVDPAFYSHLTMDGALGMAESYLQGHWHTDNLTALLRIFCRNLKRLPDANSRFAAVRRQVSGIVRNLNANTRPRSRRRIAAHYDLSNEFFELFLDPTLMYSSAYFENDSSTLHEASVAKLERLCRKLELQSTDRVLEIGTGWGGFALHAVQHFGINLTTTTISQAQFSKASERFAGSGISDRVQLLDTDYRDLTGQFDKIVSVEMVEAVGERFLGTYFDKCARLLKPGGRFVIQAIVMPEERQASYRCGMDFIQKYIFPGGFLPSVAALQESVGRTSNLRLQSVEDLSPHYATTLDAWRQRFLNRVDDVRSLGFDDRFIRMWEYYLCYCEAAFREQAVRVVQIVWDKPMY